MKNIATEASNATILIKFEIKFGNAKADISNKRT